MRSVGEPQTFHDGHDGDAGEGLDVGRATPVPRNETGKRAPVLRKDTHCHGVLTTAVEDLDS
jgi:hypothetical protein